MSLSSLFGRLFRMIGRCLPVQKSSILEERLKIMLSQVKTRLEQYFFSEEVPYGFALMRMTLPIVLFEEVMLRWRYAVDLYSTEGMPVTLWNNFGHANLFPPMPPFWAACFLSIHACLLLTSMLGFYTNFSLAGACLLHTYFAITDAPTSMTKFSVIAAHALFLMSLSGCGKIWSLDYWFAACRGEREGRLLDRPAWALTPVWPHRLLLILIGMVYLGAAITKLHMPTFLNGEALIYWMISNPNFRHFIGDWLSQNPGLLILSVHFTVLWETMFLFLCWSRFPRAVLLVMGLGFHFMAALTLGEVIFLGIMTSLYMGVLDEYEIGLLRRWLSPIYRVLRNWVPRRDRSSEVTKISDKISDGWSWITPRMKLATMAVLLLTIGLGGGWWNLSLDLYGQQRPEGRYELPEIEPAEVQRLFAPMQAIREVDKFLAVDIGSLIVSNRLANRKEKFDYGDTLICELSLNPPHEDMWVECQMLGPDQKLFDREGKIIPREMMYAQFNYKLSEALEPGEYTLMIRSRGQEICRRTFTVGNVSPLAKKSKKAQANTSSTIIVDDEPLVEEEDLPPVQEERSVDSDELPPQQSEAE